MTNLSCFYHWLVWLSPSPYSSCECHMNYFPSTFFVAKAIKEVWQQRQNGWHLIDRAMFQESGREIIWMLSIRINPSSLQNILSCEQRKGKMLKEFDEFELIEAHCWGSAVLAVLTGCWKEVWFCLNAWHIASSHTIATTNSRIISFLLRKKKKKPPCAEVDADLKLPDACGNLEMTLF